eukprot:TRINITY_DN3461_c0_g1_i1.p1 TRINITY_DN3461_c0_g1~~TRINITY_DN3461_c0_g1_i1.p1  ORF type:complete len:511 (+),score=89.07 TRINITY_DN3461_c0_g1_i1:39-1535(+)
MRRASVVVLFSYLGLVLTHNYVTTPVSRNNQAVTQTACRFGGEGNPTCAGPCDAPANRARAPITVSRGQNIYVGWVRHFHPGGFIRFSWVPTANSDSHTAFDQNAYLYMCKEIGGCGPSNSNPESDTGVGCGATIPVPANLGDGLWTLQWAYYGGFFNAGDYYSCIDYRISGGATGAAPTPVFRPGDTTYSDKCKYFSTNKLHVCPVEPCTNAPEPGERSGRPDMPTGTVNPPTPPPGPVPAPNGQCYSDPSKAVKLSARQVNSGSCSAGDVRCNDNQCCSKFGFCGPLKSGDGTYKNDEGQTISESDAFNLYCTENTGDWRVKQCPAPPPPAPSGSCYGDPSKATKLDGKIVNAGPCTAANVRCADGQCCSKYGYCGSGNEYCSENQGDWRRLSSCGLCYKSANNLNLNGIVQSSNKCGFPGSRCSDNQCCSKYGFCGTGNDYCTENQGDWRLVDCDSTNSISPRDAIFENGTITDFELGNANRMALGFGLAYFLAQ